MHSLFQKIGWMLFASVMVIFCCVAVFGNGSGIVDNSGQLLHSPNFIGGATMDGNYMVEGHPTHRCKIRKINLSIRDGVTPGTNINIDQYVTGYAYNNPGITSISDMPADSTDSEWSLNVAGTIITLDCIEVVAAVMSISTSNCNLENSSATAGYFVSAQEVGDNIELSLYKQGSLALQSWLVATNIAGTLIRFDLLFLTMD